MRHRVLLTLVLVAGCGKSQPSPQPTPPAPPTLPDPVTATAAPAAVTTTQAEKPAPPPIDEAEVRALLAVWLQAQNDGDFEAYSALYAERFFGTKRSGSRTRSFERKFWLRDRKRMFSKAMQVQAAEVAVASTAESAVLTFAQSWASGSYKDVGPKQLVIVRSADGLRIAREEMLGSTVESGDAPAAALPREDFAFVIHEDNQAYVVLDLRPEAAWSKGKLQLLAAGARATVRQPAVVDALPEPLRGWVGRDVQVNGSSGPACRGHVDKLYVLTRVEPHFGTVQYWQGEEGGAPVAKWRVAREAWGLGQGGRLLVGHIKPVSREKCGTGFWARAMGRAETKVAGSAAADPLVVREALNRFRKLSGYVQVQKAYLAETSLPRPPWWDGFQDAKPSVTFLQGPEGEGGWISVASRAGDGCGEFIGEFWALWQIRPPKSPGKAPTLVLLSDERDPGRFFMPELAVDLDGDGRVEFLSGDAIMRQAGAELRDAESIDVPNLDCPC